VLYVPFSDSTNGTHYIHKSDTPLTTMVQAILSFSNAKSSISAKQLERELDGNVQMCLSYAHADTQGTLGQNGEKLKEDSRD